MKYYSLLLVLLLTLTCFAQSVEKDGKIYKVKKEKIFLGDTDVTETLSIEEKQDILKQAAIISDKIKAQQKAEKATKKLEKEKKKAEKSQKKAEKELEKRVYTPDKKYIAISHCIKKELMEHFNIPSDNISIIYHGVDHELSVVLANGSIGHAVAGIRPIGRTCPLPNVADHLPQGACGGLGGRCRVQRIAGGNRRHLV